MFSTKNFISKLFSSDSEDFDRLALELFRFQWKENNIYQSYCHHLKRTPKNVKKLTEIPFLPIEFFKSEVIKTGIWNEEKIYLSSGTTKAKERSHHFIRDNQLYLDLSKRTFEQFHGKIEDYIFIVLLPSYQEQGDSSLIAMINYFMHFAKPQSSYFIGDYNNLVSILMKYQNEKICLFGVSYALLDLIEKYSLDLPNTIVMETGGMKGRRKEIIRQDLHISIKKGLKPFKVCSEYGMTELTSQAYSEGSFFNFPPWARVLIRDINDPFSYVENGKNGGINIIDLGNVHSCAFIETQDLGKNIKDNGFEVLGRYDHSDIRGCNLMMNQ